eukprot:1964156-Pyramimonas_sp.AAC.2
MTASRGVLRRAIPGRAVYANVHVADSASTPKTPPDNADQRRPQQPEPVQAIVPVDLPATQTSCKRQRALAVDADEIGKVNNPQT